MVTVKSRLALAVSGLAVPVTNRDSAWAPVEKDAAAAIIAADKYNFVVTIWSPVLITMRSNDRAAAFIPLMVNIRFRLFLSSEYTLRTSRGLGPDVFEILLGGSANVLVKRRARTGACPQHRAWPQADEETRSASATDALAG